MEEEEVRKRILETLYHEFLNSPQGIAEIQSKEIAETLNFSEESINRNLRYLEGKKEIECEWLTDDYGFVRITSDGIDHFERLQKEKMKEQIVNTYQKRSIPECPITFENKRTTQETVILEDDGDDVVLSFAGEDRVYVRKVAECLIENNVKIFYDEYEEIAMWGKDLIPHLESRISHSRFFVPFISKLYVKKAYPSYEAQCALAKAIQEKDPFILPAHFDDTKLPGLPSSVKYISLSDKSPEKFARMIIEKMRVLDVNYDSKHKEQMIVKNSTSRLEEKILWKGQITIETEKAYDFKFNKGDIIKGLIKENSNQNFDFYIMNEKNYSLSLGDRYGCNVEKSYCDKSSYLIEWKVRKEGVWYFNFDMFGKRKQRTIDINLRKIDATD